MHWIFTVTSSALAATQVPDKLRCSGSTWLASACAPSASVDSWKLTSHWSQCTAAAALSVIAIRSFHLCGWPQLDSGDNRVISCCVGMSQTAVHWQNNVSLNQGMSDHRPAVRTYALLQTVMCRSLFITSNYLLSISQKYRVFTNCKYVIYVYCMVYWLLSILSSVPGLRQHRWQHVAAVTHTDDAAGSERGVVGAQQSCRRLPRVHGLVVCAALPALCGSVCM